MRRCLGLTVLLLPLSPVAFAQHALFRDAGNPSDRYGSAVDGAGDVNADGFLDFIVGAGDYHVGNATPGGAFVYSGRDNALLYSFRGDLSGDYFGDTVSSAGDVDADGFADVIVGASQVGLGKRGYARVFAGKDGTVIYTFYGDLASDNLGYEVSEAGDVNADGYADVLVEAWPTSRNGYVRMYSGKDGTTLFTVHGSDNVFGLSLAAVGDVNHDGLPDFLASDPADTVNGAIRVYSGSTGAFLFKATGDGAFGSFGWAAAATGDVNGDGTPDFIGGAPNQNSNKGHLKVCSGTDGAGLWAADGDSSSNFFGFSVSGAGDIDQDGFADFLGGSFLNDRGYVRIFSGKTGQQLRRYDSTRNAFGISSALVGDINHDGVAEHIVGASFDDMIVVYSGLTYQSSFSNYGSGWPGTDGIPDFTANYLPVLCTQITLTVGNSAGVQTPGVIFAGLSQASLPTAWGGTLLVLPLQAIPLVIPATGFAPIIHVPCDVPFLGATVYLQLLEKDAGASLGVSFSAGLALTIGLGKDD